MRRRAAVLLALLLAAALCGLSVSPLGAQERLPGGGTAQAGGRGPVEAWYARPTGRYAHGVLGDAVEGGSLVALDHGGRRHEIVLPESHVFEDVTPRLADLDGDGTNEIVTIRTDAARGAAVAVYGIAGGTLTERAATAPIGRPNRWLSIAAIADFAPSPGLEIAIVKTPHIGGRLEVLSLRGEGLARRHPPATGFSTHFIGSPHTSLAAAGDLDGDGFAELALPDQSRRELVVLRLRDGVETLSRTALPARVARPMRIDAEGRIIVPLETGETVTVGAR